VQHFLQDRYAPRQNLYLGAQVNLSPPRFRVVMLDFMVAPGRPDSGEISMTKTFALVALALGLAGAPALAYAQDACTTQATDKKLYGAAKTSFLKKCQKTTCESQASDKKLHGAAQASFVKKCKKDSMAM
jgi:hypothetical protein